ncbi:hypothetical protein AJ80_09453 [Polytolypa hystricis UAMH7299]|uniref:Uncharacterized protein n=1 Tax=Polytolypa hystricis (strain UAMH7299) TaxID=1447883 RepID=A0A2B7WQT1_POLH7|nr:hypothetical protein AJ80_09453 [Polytolypa hystricis UAMH7299]
MSSISSSTLNSPWSKVRKTLLNLLPWTTDPDTMSSTESFSGEGSFFSPSPTDIGLVRTALKSTKPALPTELADMILDFADYNVKDVAENTFLQSRYSVQDPLSAGVVVPGPLIREMKLDGPELRDLKIKSVRFELASRDQGWGGEHNTQGTYNCAWSWFEVTILRPQENPTTATDASEIDFDSRHRDPEDFSDSYQRCGWDFVRDERGKARGWSVQSNRVATREIELHEILWEADGGKKDLEEPGEDNGSGTGEGFIGALRPGDLIILWARALFPGWANYVERARVEVEYTG